LILVPHPVKLRASQGFWGTREHLFQGNKGYFWDKFEGKRDIFTVKGNIDKKILGNNGIY